MISSTASMALKATARSNILCTACRFEIAIPQSERMVCAHHSEPSMRTGLGSLPCRVGGAFSKRTSRVERTNWRMQ
jgi:hypothetical protein